MKIFTNINENIPKNCVVTVGFFDGLHLGHRYLLDNLKKLAFESGVEELVITLWPHPAIVMGRSVKLLNTLDEKIKLFEEAGIRNILVLEFDKNLASLSFEKFVNTILYSKLSCSAVIMGYNNSFGNKNLVEPTNEKPVISIHRLNKFEMEAFEKVNSSNIRKFLECGEVEKASAMLGYNYNLSGKIVSGYKIGRKIGFPTANIGEISKDKLIPANGVYIVKAHIGSSVYPAMLNIGYRPSFNGNEISLEFHIPNFDGDLYDTPTMIEFNKYLRSEKKFEKLEDLISQLEIDKQQTIAYFT
ncbi:MAG: riboflavin biosynthesis protein RibF [Bacteroidales bacterium]|nr:riboflavin biosynthesis protein RibF [Bacteroidales bacterium]